MRFLVNWRGYGYCTTCNVGSQEPCKGLLKFLPCVGRESYERFCERWSLILSDAFGYTILPEEVYKYETGELNYGNDAA